MTAIFQVCEKTPMVSDRLTISIITPMMSVSVCLRRVVGIASYSQHFEHMLYIMLDTSASVMGLNWWKQD